MLQANLNWLSIYLDSFLQSLRGLQFSGLRAFMAPLQVFLVPWSNAAIYSAHVWWFFLTSHCAHFRKIAGSGKVKSPEPVCWPHLRKVCNHVRASFSRSDFLSSRIHYSTSMCKLYISEFVYLWPEVRSESWPLYYKPTGEKMKCVLFRAKESKPPSSFRIMSDYLICNEPGGIYSQGHREGPSKVMWGRQ